MSKDFVRCPTCGEGYCHFVSVTYNTRVEEDGEVESVTVGADGSISCTGDMMLSSRRDQARVTFEGECGHFFYLILNQHKGRTSLKTLSLEDTR